MQCNGRVCISQCFAILFTTTSCPKNKSGFIHGTLLPEQPVLVYSNESYGCGGGAREWMSPHGEVWGFWIGYH